MKNPAAFALEHPHVVWLATLMALCYGALSYLDLPRQENPTLPDRFASVITYLPGASPEKVELLVSKVLEDRIAEVDDIDAIFSESVQGTSYLQIELVKGAPYAERLAELSRKVEEARALLPDNALEPEVETRLLRTNTMLLAVTGQELSPLALREQAKLVERRLEFLADIGRVELLGEAYEEIEVAVDVRELAQRELPLASVVAALEARNTLLPSGLLELDSMRTAIQTSGSYGEVTEIAGSFLGAGESGMPIVLGDVARVQRQLADQKVRVRWNGVPAVSIALEMLPGRNAIAVGKRIRALIDGLATELVPGVAIEILADEPRYVGERLGKLTGSLTWGLVIVMGLTLLGLGWRSGLIISVSIPLAITIALGFIGAAGIALHQISIAALVIAVGLVVDEDIVVVDNIKRHLDLGKSPAQAAIAGLGEIHMPILAGAATTIAAFIPLALMTGDIGHFVRTIPIAVSLMLVASVITAHFFTPLFAAYLYRDRGSDAGEGREQHRWEPPYRRALSLLLRHRIAVLLSFVVLFFATTFGIGSALWPPDFFNDADRHQFLVEIFLPSGSPVAETNQAAEKVEQMLAADERIHSWGTYVGAGVPKFYYNQFTERKGEHVAMFLVNTHDWVPFDETREVAEDLDRLLDSRLAGVWARAQVLKQGYGGGQAVRIFVQGESTEVLRTLALGVREIVEEVEGAVNVRDTFGYDPLTLNAKVDYAKANLLGISTRDIATTLRTALDGVTATTFREDDEEIAIRVRTDAAQRRHVDDLGDLLLYSPASRSNVPLAHVASIEPGFTSRGILRWRRKREAGVVADIAGGYTIMGVADAVEKAVSSRISVPPGYEISFHGQHKEVTESFTSLARAGVVAIFLIYIILVIQFSSLSQPALIILAIPMALVGALTGLAMTGQPLGFMAFLGMTSLIGIVVNDSIVLLDCINRLRAGGLSLDEAVVQGAGTRLRAITLTSLTTIGGLLPLSISGGTLFASFGVAMIFGLIGSTALTLIVQPISYHLLESRKSRRRKSQSRAEKGQASEALPA